MFQLGQRNPEKAHKLFRCILLLNFIIYILNTFKNDSTSYSHIEELLDGFSYFIENIQNPPIQDIQLIKKETNCPLDYQRLILGEWPGTYQGCVCNYQYDYPTYSLGRCDRESDSQITCNDLKSVDSVSLLAWSNISFCVKYIQDPLIPQGKICPINYKYCSSSICVPSKDQCPITSIQIVEITKNILEQSAQLNFNNTHKFVIYREIDKQPLIKLIGSFSRDQCFSKSKIGYIENSIGQTLPFDKLSTNQCGRYGKIQQEDITRIIDIQDRIKIFYENDILAEASHIPNYFDYHVNNSAYLLQQNRIYIQNNEICRDHTTTQLTNIHSNLNSLTQWTLTQHILTILLNLGFFFFLAANNRDIIFQKIFLGGIIYIFLVFFVNLVYYAIVQSTQNRLGFSNEQYQRFLNFQCINHNSVHLLYEDLLKLIQTDQNAIKIQSLFLILPNFIYLTGFGLIYLYENHKNKIKIE